MTKEQLRIKFKKRRKELNSSQVDFLSRLILDQLIDSGINLSKQNACSFLPIVNSNEVNTYYILDYLKSFGSNIYLTKTLFEEKKLELIKVEDVRDTKINTYNIPEPENGIPAFPSELTLVFVPLLAFSKDGHRVGYGGGFYDRFLRNIKGLKIGLSLFDECSKIQDIEHSDIQLDYCFTPFNCYKFG